MRWEPRVTQSFGAGEALHVAVGHPLVDEYLEFLNARARPNTRLAVAFDLKVFFSVVDKTPVRVTSADVMAFIRSQWAGGAKVVGIDGSAGLSSRTSAGGCRRVRILRAKRSAHFATTASTSELRPHPTDRSGDVSCVGAANAHRVRSSTS
jgi:hypothetical protein